MQLSFADPAKAQSTLRGLRLHLLDPSTAMILCSVALVLTLIDALDLRDDASLGLRITYLTVMVWTTYAVGWLTGATFGVWLKSLGIRSMFAWLLQGSVAGLFILGVVFGLNWFTFGQTGLAAFLSLAPTVICSVMVITVALEFVGSQPRRTAGREKLPPLLARLPFGLRGSLLSFSAEDHYIRVRTSRGDHLLLLRFSDAVRETEPTEGLQVHRSHWVAREAIVKVTRGKDRAVLTLCDGTRIPVSRRYLPALRDSGLLPSSGAKRMADDGFHIL